MVNPKPDSGKLGMAFSVERFRPPGARGTTVTSVVSGRNSISN